MPKLWIMSDLHLETIPYPEAFAPKEPDFDILVAAGDIWEGDCLSGFRFLRKLAKHKPIVFVMGNHEHWNGELSENLRSAEMLARAYGVSLLECSAITVSGCLFVEGTLWSDYALAAETNPQAETGQQIDVEHADGTHLRD